MKQLFLLFFSICALLGKAQEYLSYANADGSTIDFAISNKKFVIRLKSGEALSRLALVNADFQMINEQYGMVEINSKSTSKSQQLQQIQAHNSNQEIIQEPVLVYKDGIEQVVLGEMIIKLNENSLDELLSDYSYTATPDEFVAGQFVIKFDDLSTLEIFDLANEWNRSPKVDFAEPNFTRFLKPHTADPFYNSQWSLRNQGYLGGTVDADMDVDLAWNTATGQGIKEAKYIHGVLGKGFWTFYGGHDPEDYQHFVNEPPTDLNLHPNSAGYRLILNNILFPAAKKKKQKT